MITDTNVVVMVIHANEDSNNPTMNKNELHIEFFFFLIAYYATRVNKVKNENRNKIKL